MGVGALSLAALARSPVAARTEAVPVTAALLVIDEVQRDDAPIRASFR